MTTNLSNGSFCIIVICKNVIPKKTWCLSSLHREPSGIFYFKILMSYKNKNEQLLLHR